MVSKLAGSSSPTPGLLAVSREDRLRAQCSAGGGDAIGRAYRLERLDYQDASHHPRQYAQRQPAPDVRHLRAAQLPLVNPRLHELAEQPTQLAARAALRRFGLRPGV